MVAGSALVKKNRTKSCGCLTREISSITNSTHGLSKSREYSSWRAMRKRCLNPKHSHFSNYGGRGITIHPAWVSNFEAFYSDMGPMPDGGYYSIDRKDNDGNYEPDNCRWADRFTQQANRSDPKSSRFGAPGISERADGRWKAFMVFRKEVILNTNFDTLEEAVAPRREAEDRVKTQIESTGG